MGGGKVMSSEYMYWAKTHSSAAYNLAISDLDHCRIDDLYPERRGFELTGPGRYVFSPLTEAIASRYGVQPECVVLSVGTSLANHIAMAALVNAGGEGIPAQPASAPLSSTPA